MMRNWVSLFCAILGGILLAIIGTTPPFPQSEQADDVRFSASRAMQDVEVIARAPHPTGSAEHARVRDYLQQRLNQLGAQIILTEGEVPESSLTRFGKWSGTRPDALTLTNVIGVLPGQDPSQKAVALMAHYDTVWGSPGAPDDTAGVASILETVRAIQSQGQTRRDIIILLTDGEELGLLGASQFFASNPLADRIGAIINLEARGGGGRTTLFQTSADNGEAIKLYSDAVSRPGGSSLATFVYNTLPNDTDLTPALKRDYAAYNLSFIGRPGLYHSPKATPARLDQGALQDMGDQTLALTQALANAEQLPTAEEDRTFFDVFGLFLIQYGSLAGWLLLGLAAVLHILCLGGSLRADWWQRLAVSGAVILGGGVLLYLFNLISGAGSGEGIYYDRLAAIPMLEVQALLICVGVLAGTAPLWAGRGGSIVGLLIAVAMQVMAPTTSFLVVWPLLLSGIGGVAAIYLKGKTARVIGMGTAALVIGMLLQFGHQFMQGVGPDMPSIVALLAALAIPALGPLVPAVSPTIRGKRAMLVAGLCLLGALAVALYVRFDAEADTVPVYDSMKG